MQAISELREFGNKIFCCACFLFTIGPILMVVGISFLASSATDTRGDALSKFNAASSTWDGTGASAFQAASSNFTVGILPSGAASFSYAVPLAKQTAPANFPDTAGATLPATALYFSGTGQPLTPYNSWKPTEPASPANPQPLGPANLQQMTLVRNSVSGASSPLPITPLWSSATTMSCKSSSTASSSSDCKPSCNTYVSSNTGTTRTCYAFYALSSVCLVVQPGSGVLDDAGGAGCVPGGGSPVPASVTGLDTRTNLAKFGFSPTGGGGTPSITQSYFNIPVTVRASTDPYVQALRLTKGTLDFGLTTAQKVASGIGFLVAGGLLTFLVCGGLYAFVKNCQHRKPNFVLQQQGAPGYAPQQAMYAQPMPPMPMQPQMQMQPQPQYYPQQAPMQPPYGGQPMYAQQPPPMYGGVPQGYAQQPQYQPVQQQQQYPQAFRNSV